MQAYPRAAKRMPRSPCRPLAHCGRCGRMILPGQYYLVARSGLTVHYPSPCRSEARAKEAARA
jgi:hypothetical protein